MKTTHFLVTFFLIVCLSANSYSQLNSSSKSVQVHNPDARFTMRVEKIWSNLGGQEEYRFYVQNNTSQEFKLTINVTLDLACVGTKSFDLGIGAWQPETKAQGRIVYLRPNGRFEPRNDYFHMYSGGVDNGRACRITDGDSFTLLNGIQYNITSVINVTERKANEEQKKIKEATLKQKQLEDEKKDREAQAKEAADKKTIADAEKQKQAANSSSKNNSQSSSSNNNNNKQSGEITNMSEYVGMEGSNESIKVYQQNGRYYIKSQNGSTTETDKQYFDKIQTVSAGNAQIASNNEQIRKQNDPLANYKEPTTNSYNNNPMTNSNSTNNSYTQAANAIGSALTQWGDQMAADRLANEQRQQEREEEDERRQAAAAIVRANKQKLVNNRKSLIAKFPDSKTPLSYEAKNVTEIYYFVYSYQAATIGSDAPVIYISNEFSLAKYADGTWPFKASLMEKITKTNKGLDFTLSGYYLTQIEAAEQKQLFINSANEHGFIVNKISYISKKSSETSNGTVDYWGNPIKKTEQQPATNSPAKQEPVKSKPNLDYWGNPIKE